MAKVAWILVARGASIDRETNAATIFSVVDGLTVGGFPIVVQHLSVVAMVRRQPNDPSNVEASLRITHNGKKLFQGGVTIEFGEKQACQLNIGVNGLVIPTPGESIFAMLIGGRLKGKVSLQIVPLPGSVTADGAESATPKPAVAPPRTPSNGHGPRKIKRKSRVRRTK